MSEGYGEHCERLAGYGVGSGELRNYEPFSLENAETVEGNTREEQTIHCDRCGLNVYRTRWQHHITWCNAKNTAAVNVTPSSAIPEDAEESYCDWLNERERNQCENERMVEEQAWRDQELLQEETDNT